MATSISANLADLSIDPYPFLFSRLPNLRLNLDSPPQFQGWVFRGMTNFHLQFDA